MQTVSGQSTYGKMHSFPGPSTPAPALTKHLGILFHQLREIVEEAVLWTEEVKLVVALLFLHQLGQKLAPIPGHKLSRQLHHVQVEGRDGGGVCDELKLGRGLFGHDGLLDHLGLDLRCRGNMRQEAHGWTGSGAGEGGERSTLLLMMCTPLVHGVRET